MAEHGIGRIDLIVVNLYPFEATVSKPDCSYEDAVENIDIGGPAMVRASAKNHAHVTIITEPSDYERVQAEMEANGNCIKPSTRLSLAVKAFEHTARYDGMIANYFGARVDDATFEQPAVFPRTFSLQVEKNKTYATAKTHTKARRSIPNTMHPWAVLPAQSKSKAKNCRTTILQTPMQHWNA